MVTNMIIIIRRNKEYWTKGRGKEGGVEESEKWRRKEGKENSEAGKGENTKEMMRRKKVEERSKRKIEKKYREWK